MKRIGISKKTRFEVFKRDGFVCQYCGAHPPGAVLEPDHINPVANGGGNELDNLVTACFACNRGKAARLLTAVPQSLASKAAETKEREAQLAGYAEVMEAKRRRLDVDVWRVLNTMSPSADSVPRDQYRSVQMFVERLGVHAVLDAMEIALLSDASYRNLFRYFCGVCWKRVREAEK